MAPKTATTSKTPTKKTTTATKTTTRAAAPKAAKPAAIKKASNLPAAHADTYAIIQTGGKQYQAVPGATLAVEKLDGEVGTKLAFNDVLLVKRGDDNYEIGTPMVKDFK